MSDFLNIDFLVSGIKYCNVFAIEPANSATSVNHPQCLRQLWAFLNPKDIKNQTLKIVGNVDIKDVENLTNWLQSTLTEVFNDATIKSSANIAKNYKVEGKTVNSTVKGCFPVSMSFSAFPSCNPRDVRLRWRAHIVLSYDQILDNEQVQQELLASYNL